MSVAPDSTDQRHGSAVLAVVALCIGGLATALTQTMVIPIQSELPQLLHSSASNTAWVVTITTLTAAVSMVVAGRLADLFGKQRVLLISLALLAVGSLVVALSSSLAPVLVGRAIQGMAIAVIPVGISLIREVTPPEMATTATAAMSATMGVGGAIGLPLSAWIVDISNWHALFWVSVVIGLLVLALVFFAVPHIHDGHSGGFDFGGVIGLAAGLVTFLVGISKATDWGWGNVRTIGFIVVGLLVLVGWVFFELRQRDPLVDLRATAKLPVLFTNIAALGVGFGIMAQSVALPQLLEMPKAAGYGLGQTILEAGLWMAPSGLMMLLFAPVSARIITNAGAKIALLVGAGVLAVGYVAACFLTDAPWQILVSSCVTSTGVAIGYAAMPTLILDNTPPAEAGAAVGLNALMRAVGTTTAAAVMGTLLTSNTKPLGSVEIPTHSAFIYCFIAGAVAATIAIVATTVVPGRRRLAAELDEIDLVEA